MFLQERPDGETGSNVAVMLTCFPAQARPPSKTRNQIFVIRCHKYGCFDNAG
jgi:hypothetical protein